MKAVKVTKSVKVKVKIKTWKQMEEEFGLNDEGNIAAKDIFVRGMEEMMPDDRIIEIVSYNNSPIFRWGGWSITADMIEKIFNEKDYPEYYI